MWCNRLRRGFIFLFHAYFQHYFMLLGGAAAIGVVVTLYFLAGSLWNLQIEPALVLESEFFQSVAIFICIGFALAPIYGRAAWEQHKAMKQKPFDRKSILLAMWANLAMLSGLWRLHNFLIDQGEQLLAADRLYESLLGLGVLGLVVAWFSDSEEASTAAVDPQPVVIAPKQTH